MTAQLTTAAKSPGEPLCASSRLPLIPRKALGAEGGAQSSLPEDRGPEVSFTSHATRARVVKPAEQNQRTSGESRFDRDFMRAPVHAGHKVADPSPPIRQT